jgi:hypothetical protein
MKPLGPHIRKKCTKCGSTFAVLVGDTECRRTSFTKPPCDGQLEMFSDSLEDSISNLLAVAHEINRLHKFKESELLEGCIEDLELWAEGEQTPKQMGWVGQDGLP